CQKYQRALLALLLGQRQNFRLALHGLANAQRPVKRQPSARPHATRQWHGRKEAAEPRMAIDTELRLGRVRREIDPMPQRREGTAGGRGATMIQRKREAFGLRL